MYDEILYSIDNIDDCVMEAEMNILNALCNEYDKAIMIMENYNGNDYSSFDIFMEADESTANDNSSEPKKKGLLDGPIRGSKGENIIKRILLVIPRLIATLVRSFKKKWDNRKSQQLIKRIEFLENLTQEQKKQLTELQEGLNDTNQRVSDNSTRIQSLKTNVDMETESLRSGLGTVSAKSYEMSGDLNRIKRVIDVMNETVKTEMDFDTAKSYLQDVLKMIETLEKFDPYKPSSIGKDVMDKVNEGVNARRRVIYELHLDEPISYKLSDVKKYVKEVSDLRDQIVDRGTELVEKMSKITTDLTKIYEGKKDTKGRQDTIKNCQTVLKYARIVSSESQKIDDYVAETFEDMLDWMTYIQQKIINKGMYDKKVF